MKNYRTISNQIFEKAEKFLTKQKIEYILKQFGRIEYFGSYKLNLMNRNDVDMILIVDEIKISIVTALMKELNSKGFNRHWVFDNTDGGCKSDPKHIVYEAVYGFYNENIKEEDRWELGIVITTEAILDEVLKLTKEVSNYSKEDKETILRLKFELSERFGEHKYTGSQVYTAVSKGVKTVDQFIDHLQ